jgi:hypothetical protein
MPSTDRKPELTAKASIAQPVSQPAVYANGLKQLDAQKPYLPFLVNLHFILYFFFISM